MNNEVKRIHTPLDDEVIKSLKPGDMVLLSGKIYCGRDAVLPKVCKLIKEIWNVIFHTAVSPAGVGPTSSNKLEIESSFPLLSKAGVKVHLGKGAVGKETIEILKKYNSVYAVIPPVTALLGENTLSRKVIAFSELGMEALYELEIRDYPIIIAAAHGESIY